MRVLLTLAALVLALGAFAAAPPVVQAAAAAHPEPGDMDGDGVKDEVDNCPTIRNGDQRNTDGDPPGDACDDDMDGDGVRNADDICPPRPNPEQDPSKNPCSEDPDQDGRPTFDDNCIDVYNPDQGNFDLRLQYSDPQGDACDPDDDGDGRFDDVDNCPLAENPEQVDADGDGRGSVCDADDTPKPPGTVEPGTDAAPPALALSLPRRQRLAAVQSGLVVRVRCSEACAVTARLTMRGLRGAGAGAAQVERAATTYAFVRFSKAAKRRLWRRARTRLTLRLEAVDRAGNTSRLVRNLTLVR